MRCLLGRCSVLIALSALGLAGCDSGGGGDVGSGMPKETTGYVPLGAPAGAPPVSADMTKIGNRPGKASKAATPAPSSADAAEKTP
jgi:hypothetical protein